MSTARRRPGFINYTNLGSRSFRITKDPRNETPIEPLKKRVRILGEYDLFGDITTDDWIKRNLDFSAKEFEDVISAEFLIALTGAWGLRRVLFFVDAEIVVGSEEMMTNEAYEILCRVVNENDVRVNFISSVS